MLDLVFQPRELLDNLLAFVLFLAIFALRYRSVGIIYDLGLLVLVFLV